MRINPLTGMLRPVQICFTPDGGGGSGGGSNGNSGTDDVIPDDLKIDFGLDPDMLPADEREKFLAAQTKLQALQKRLMSATNSEQAINDLKQQIAQLTQQQQQPKTEPKADTFEDRMRNHYKSVGVPPEQVEGLIKLNGPVFEMLAQGMVGHMGEVVAPVTERAMMGELKGTFLDLQDSDPRFQIPEVAQAIWEKSQSIAKKGGEVSIDVMRNLARIAYMEIADTNPEVITKSNLPPQRTQTTIAPRMPNNTTRQTYPGAGSVVRTPHAPQPTMDLDPATAAAVGHVKGTWDGYLKDGKQFTKQAPLRR